MKSLFSFTLFMSFTISSCSAQENILPLWPEIIPNHQESDEIESRNQSDILRIGNVQIPTLEIYLPTTESATGRAVVICPGGGYQILAYDWEGTDVAKWLNTKGIAAFVLKYRLPKSKSIILGNEAPLQDAQRAIKIVRSNSEKWNINKNQIGIMGFSAGGHLASTLGTHYDHNKYKETDNIDTLSAKPNFMVLIYPVITMKDTYTHRGSKANLIGKNPNQELIDYYSNELHVDNNTPPTFIVHSTDDKSVHVMNSILFYQALKKEEIYTEMHIYPEGGHGFSLAIGKGHLQSWPDRLYDWIESLH